jgi:hypothetical protein
MLGKQGPCDGSLADSIRSNEDDKASSAHLKRRNPQLTLDPAKTTLAYPL